uniref:uncharacterized protein LOC117611118 isoform X1 n=1 Tax=Osmia lignaria TaxID=473952 RepID=UPI0014795877|nr:uncharacterized protein LOC117611118 isoform X1 [Osmia lignaria]XP_034195215.1 uncharacterized protein LOC117611394 isoform X1 [Osmia lignaria]
MMVIYIYVTKQPVSAFYCSFVRSFAFIDFFDLFLPFRPIFAILSMLYYYAVFPPVQVCHVFCCPDLGLDVTYEAFSLRTPPWALEKSMSQNIHDQSVPEPCDNPKVVVHPGTILLGLE